MGHNFSHSMGEKKACVIIHSAKGYDLKTKNKGPVAVFRLTQMLKGGPPKPCHLTRLLPCPKPRQQDFPQCDTPTPCRHTEANR